MGRVVTSVVAKCALGSQSGQAAGSRERPAPLQTEAMRHTVKAGVLNRTLELNDTKIMQQKNTTTIFDGQEEP